ncbi:MAG: SigB/SigF/SigG family RNA polymerase sigma factor [Actinomycetota bacterium]|nr:SigB/SigF/SigG family RNA polymerase sigma factor [Actinomycetota bacterium]
MVKAHAQVDESSAFRLRRDELTEHLIHRLSQVDDGLDRQRLREEIVLLNVPVAEAVAARYRNRGAEHEDLVQVARMALIKAVDRYDSRRGTGFVGFAVPTISGEVKRYFRDQCWGIRPTRRIQETQHAIQRVEPALTQTLGRAPRAAELAAEIGVDEDEVIEALACDGFFHLVPLDAPGAGASPTMADQVGGCDRHLEWVETHETLRPALEDLSERERLMLRLRFDDGCTQNEIATRLGISQMQVSRLLKAVYLRLRGRIEHEPAAAV